MNDFTTELTSTKYTYKIKHNSILSAEMLEKQIDKDFLPRGIKDNRFSVMYVYYLYDKKIRYNNKKTNVLYIGSTTGEIKGDKIFLGYRFKHLMSGKDNKQNIVLNYYYNKGYTIGLDLFFVENCRNVEKDFIYKFIIEYKSQPVAHGASYNKRLAELYEEKNKTSKVYATSTRNKYHDNL